MSDTYRIGKCSVCGRHTALKNNKCDICNEINNEAPELYNMFFKGGK